MANALMPQGQLLAFIDPEVRKARQQIDARTNAFVRAAANTMTFHGTDRLEAATHALFDRRSQPVRQRYAAQLARQRRLNEEAARSHPVATAAGQVAGTVADVTLVAPEYLAARMVPRIAGVAGMTAREGAKLVGAGAATNAGFQLAADGATGTAPTAQNTAAAALGGAVGGVLLPAVGPARAAAVSEWTTSAAQDVMNGRPISAEAAGQAAMGGALLGHAGGSFAVSAIDDLAPVAKGRLGEWLGAARSRLNGEGDTTVPKRRDYFNGKPGPYWYPDRRRGEVRYEDKLGYQDELRKNQKLAQAALRENFVLNHFAPEDIGSLVGYPLGMVGGDLVDEAIRLPENIAEIIAANRAKREAQR